MDLHRNYCRAEKELCPKIITAVTAEQPRHVFVLGPQHADGDWQPGSGAACGGRTPATPPEAQRRETGSALHALCVMSTAAGTANKPRTALHGGCQLAKAASNFLLATLGNSRRNVSQTMSNTRKFRENRHQGFRTISALPRRRMSLWCLACVLVGACFLRMHM